MSTQEKQPVNLNQFLNVARDQGAHKTQLDRASDYLNADGVQDVIEMKSTVQQISIEKARSEQLSTYLGVDADKMPLLAL